MSRKKAIKYKLVDSEKDIVKSYEDRRKPKRERLLLSDWQSMMLEQSFRLNSYPDRTEKYNLFLKTKVPMKNIKIWFQNRRAREKYLQEDRTEEIGQKGDAGQLDFDPHNSQFEEEFYKYYKY